MTDEIINIINNKQSPEDTIRKKININNNKYINNYVNNYINGYISGIVGVVISHPIDTIKTHIQTGNKLNTFKPSLLNFYKGITSPIIGVGFEKALVFGTYNYILSKTESIPISGALSGLTASLIVTPYERLKILKQNESKLTIKDLNIKFLYRGLNATFTREVPGFAIYFSTYEFLKYNKFTKYNKKIDYSHSFLYGGMSGITAWIFIYPQDKIKTILQSSIDTNNTNINNISIKTIINNIYKTGGIKQFYSGFFWAVSRATLLHSGTFCMMEYLTNTNNNNNTNTNM